MTGWHFRWDNVYIIEPLGTGKNANFFVMKKFLDVLPQPGPINRDDFGAKVCYDQRTKDLIVPFIKGNHEEISTEKIIFHHHSLEISFGLRELIIVSHGFKLFLT